MLPAGPIAAVLEVQESSAAAWTIAETRRGEQGTAIVDPPRMAVRTARCAGPGTAGGANPGSRPFPWICCPGIRRGAASRIPRW